MRFFSCRSYYFVLHDLDHNLYEIKALVKVKNENIYLLYQFINQDGELKLVGIHAASEPKDYQKVEYF